MKKLIPPSRHACLLASVALLSFTGHPSSAELTWQSNTNSSTPRLWSDAANWKDALAPTAHEESPIFIGSNISGASFTVQWDVDQTLRGGLSMRWGTTVAGLVALNLDGHRLVFEGGALQFDPASGSTSSRTVAAFQNGVVQFKSGASLVLGGTGVAGTNTSAYTIEFQRGTTFDSAGLGSLEVVNSATNITQNMILDLSAATMVADGASDALHTQSSITVAAAATTKPSEGRNQTADLRLGVLSSLNVGADLVVGSSAITSTAATFATGRLSFSTAPEQGAVAMSVGRNVLIGVGAGASGSIMDTPEVLHLRFGSDEAVGGIVAIGSKASGNGSGNASGVWVAKEGTFEGHIQALRVGVNQAAAGGASGMLDFRSLRLASLHIDGGAMIGVGNGAVGEVRLKGGEVFSTSLEVGRSTAGERSSLILDGTLWHMTAGMTIGSMGEVVVHFVDGLGGLSLESDGALTIETGGQLTVLFDIGPGDEGLWGLRVRGDHLSLLEGYLANGQLVASGALGGDAELSLVDGYTYFGLAAIPEPSGLLFSLGGLAGVFGLVRLRRGLVLGLLLGCGLSGVAMAERSAVAIVGIDYAVKSVADHVVKPLGMPVELFGKGGPAVANYKNYAALIFAERLAGELPEEALWSQGENLEMVKGYLEQGGTIVIVGFAYPRRVAEGDQKARQLRQYESILGYGFYPKVHLSNPARLQPLGAEWAPELASKELNWVAPYTVTVAKLTSAEVLAAAVDEKGELQPLVTRHKVGKGCLYWFGTSPFRLAREKGAGSAEVKEYTTFFQRALLQASVE